MTLRVVKPEIIYMCCPYPEDQANSVSYVRAESPLEAAKAWCLAHPTEALEPRFLYVRSDNGPRQVFKVCSAPQVQAL